MIQLFKKLFNSPSVNYNDLLRKGAIIVDVRTFAEYNEGHIKGSKNIPLDKLKSEISNLKKNNKPVITVCLSGMRSKAAVGILKTAGIETYNGGGWKNLLTKL